MRLLPNSLHIPASRSLHNSSHSFVADFHLICSLDHGDHGDSVYLKHGANDAQLESDFRRVLLTLVMVT